MKDLEWFLKNDLNYIKENLNINILKEKDEDRCTILHNLFWVNKDLETIKYVFVFTKKECPSLFLEKSNNENTILHYLFWYNEDLEIIKYVLDFTKLNFPSLFLEKNNSRSSIFHSYFLNKSFKGKYFFDFTKNNIPEILSENYSEKYYSKYNLILPLTFQIQN